MGVTGLAAVNLLACSSARQAHAGHSTLSRNPAARVESCLAPASDGVQARCDEWERAALASTVRLEMRVFSLDSSGQAVEQIDGSSGLATIQDGRYLVTHNHYDVSLMSESAGTISRLTLLKADGEIILTDAPLSTFRVAYEDSQTLILDFGDHGGAGFFGALGMPSAVFRPGAEVSLAAGTEIAQASWTGETARIDWVRVTGIRMDTSTPYLELDNFLERGSSGGGVFLNGVHIANNWSRSTERSVDTGEVARRYSVAALNSVEVATGGTAWREGAPGSSSVGGRLSAGSATTRIHLYGNGSC